MGEGYVDRSENRMTEGRIVHYVPSETEGGRPGHCLAAVIVRVWGDGYSAMNLAVLRDGGNDRPFGGNDRPSEDIVVWRTSAPYDPSGGTGWHNPRSCPFVEPTTS